MIRLALALLFTAQGTAQPPCLTAREAGMMIASMMPRILEDVRERCRAHLNNDAYLLSDRALDVARRMREETRQYEPLVEAIIRRVDARDQIVDLDPSLPLIDQLSQMFAPQFFGNVTQGACRNGNRRMGLFSVMSAEQIVYYFESGAAQAAGDDHFYDIRCKQ